MITARWSTGTLQLLQQKLPQNAVAAEYPQRTLQLLQLAVEEESGCVFVTDLFSHTLEQKSVLQFVFNEFKGII